jgi:hypothetical protein
MEKYNHYNYPFYRITSTMPYISKRRMAIVHNVLNIKDVEKRCGQLIARGFEVRKCYIPHYNGVGNMTYMPRLNEIRIIVGRPKCHEPRQVYAIIIKSIEK